MYVCDWLVFVLCLPPYTMDTACVHLFCSHGSQNGWFMHYFWDTGSIDFDFVWLRCCIPPMQEREVTDVAVSCWGTKLQQGMHWQCKVDSTTLGCWVSTHFLTVVIMYYFVHTANNIIVAIEGSACSYEHALWFVLRFGLCHNCCHGYYPSYRSTCILCTDLIYYCVHREHNHCHHVV